MMNQRRPDIARLVFSVLLPVVLAGCGDDPTGPVRVRSDSVRGITIADWTVDGYTAGAAQVGPIAATGANTLAIVVTAYQSDATASAVRVDAQLTPSQASVSDVILRWQPTGNAAKAESVIKLHVDLDTGAWRGTISPGDPEAWFASYGAFVLSWAQFAAAFDVPTLIIGTELAGTLMHEARWRRLIADVRAIYSGELTYAASWDESARVPFWDALDFVGVNFYAPVAGREDISRFEILSNWQPWLDRIRLLHKQTDRDVLLTEIGYRSIDGAGMHPYDFDRQAPEDFEEQADLYWAALAATGDKPWIRGVYWWNWLATGQSPASDYTPQGKLAEKELSDAWLP